MSDCEKYFNTCPCCGAERGFPTKKAANESWRVTESDLHLKARQTARDYKRLKRAVVQLAKAYDNEPTERSEFISNGDTVNSCLAKLMKIAREL